MKSATKAFFISFEGMDGAGKSSHIQRAAELLSQRGYSVHLTREPGGSAVSEKIRNLVIHDEMSLKTEALLMYAGRVQHLTETIQPALAAGKCVISDRFEDSSFAYQASAGGLGSDSLSQLSDWALEGFAPDLTLLFDLPVEVSLERITHRNEAGDKFEAKPRAYLDAVRAGFLGRAHAEPTRIKIIDATWDEHNVWKQVEQALLTFLNTHASQASI